MEMYFESAHVIRELIAQATCEGRDEPKCAVLPEPLLFTHTIYV